MLVRTGYALSNNLVSFSGAHVPLVDSGQHGLGPLYRLYRCADGWLFLGITQEHEWSALVQAPGGVLSTLGGLAWLAVNEARDHPEQLIAVTFQTLGQWSPAF